MHEEEISLDGLYAVTDHELSLPKAGGGRRILSFTFYDHRDGC